MFFQLLTLNLPFLGYWIDKSVFWLGWYLQSESCWLEVMLLFMFLKTPLFWLGMLIRHNYKNPQGLDFHYLQNLDEMWLIYRDAAIPAVTLILGANLVQGTHQITTKSIYLLWKLYTFWRNPCFFSRIKGGSYSA